MGSAKLDGVMRSDAEQNAESVLYFMRWKLHDAESQALSADSQSLRQPEHPCETAHVMAELL